LTYNAVDWIRYRHSSVILPIGVLIMWPITNLQVKSYVFISNGISSMTYFWLCRQIIFLN